MAVLQVDLQEGFTDDTVVLLLDGEEVYRRDGVRTRSLLGLADQVTLHPRAEVCHLDMRVPTRGWSGGIEVRPAETPYVGLSLTATGLSPVLSPTPFGYA